MASTFTKHELARDVLLYSGIAGAEAEIAAADRELVVRTYENLMAEWSFDDLTYWDENAIPSSVFDAVKDLVWNRVANAFRRTQSPEDQAAREVLLMKRVRRHMARRGSGYPIKADYF
jgi:hypothetical protein